MSLNSLERLSEKETQKLARCLSALTSPKVLAPNESLGWLGFDIGVVSSLYHVKTHVRSMLQSKATDHSDIADELYLAFLLGKMGLPQGFDLEAHAFMPEVVHHFSAVGGALKWTPTFFENDKYYVTPALRGSFSFTHFSKYQSRTATGDFILSSRKFNNVGIYGGGSILRIFGTYDNGVVRSGLDRDPKLWTQRYFAGINYDIVLRKNFELGLSAEAAFMTDSQAYSLKTSLIF
ncbi:MAG: hypothetical protein HYS98_05290 [Deltaproteobacteria bacterium]|nr:hypothetical protein [Deltaproteobacteria bacterium]